jgi:hypothetical protein
MGDPTGSTGLKGQWGVGNPASPTTPTDPSATDTGSDQQAQDFQAAFQQQQGVINGHLQYTSVNAEAARHEPLAARRDALYGAFQSALGKIDRNNPAKAQADIDKVLGDASALAGEVGSFRQQAEKAKNDWDSRPGSFDETVHKVEELETWEDAAWSTASASTSTCASTPRPRRRSTSCCPSSRRSTRSICGKRKPSPSTNSSWPSRRRAWIR